jgi:anti-anti-sigma regulatory factor
VRCESCPLTSEEGASLPLSTFLERIELCNDCPIELGEEPPALVPIQRLVERQREASRVMRKLANKLRKAERQIQELHEGVREHEERASKLEAVQQESARRANEELRAKMELVKQKEEAIMALSTPIIEVWERVLVLPVIGVLDDKRARVILSSLLESVARSRAQHAILDMTGVDRIDAGTADHLGLICRAVSMLGAKVILSGIRPEIVRMLADLRADLSSVVTVRSLKEALRRCGVAGTPRREAPHRRS